MASVAKPTLPSERTLAFAVTIVKSKPPELRIEEYIQLLRQHVAEGRRENAMSATYRHLDRSSFWRGESERADRALRTAELENTELRIEIDKLKGKLENAKIAQPKKRKRVDEDVIPVPRSPKRSKHDPPSLKKHSSMEKLDSLFSLQNVGEIGNILMRGLYQMQDSLKDHQNTDITAVAHAVIRVAGALPQVLVQALQHYFSAENAAADGLGLSFAALEKAVSCLTTATNRLFAVDIEALVQGHVINALVRMYGGLVECMEIVSTEDGRFDTGNTYEETRNLQRKANSKESGVKSCTPLDLLTKLLSKIIHELDVRDAGQASLFEGYAYTALRRIGDRLYLVVFGRRRADGLDDDILASQLTQDDGVSERQTALNPPGSEREAARLEAPYLVALLDCIMRAYAVYTADNKRSKTSNAQHTSKTSKKDLAARARVKIQLTLVDCIFGNDAQSDSDGLRDRLKMPTTGGPPLPMPKIKEAEIEDWYKEELWRVLGWDILSKDGDWYGKN